MLKNKKEILIIAFLAVVSVGLKAQDSNPSNNGNTPYSRYGYGRLAETSLTRNRAMGGIGYGLRSNMQTNPMNPASYTAIDSLTFLFDFAVNAQVSRLKEPGASQSETGGGLDYLAMQFPMGRRFAASIGLLPYSYVGYSYGSVDSTLIDGTDSYNHYVKQYSGNGGLNKVYLGLGAKILKDLSFGVNVGYIFGVTSNDYSVSFTDGNQSASFSYLSTTARALELQFGLQYTHTFDKKHDLTLGVVYAPKMNMWVNTDNTLLVANTDTTTTTKNYDLAIPQTFGVGATYVYDKRLTVGADFEYKSWKDVKGLNDTLHVESNLFHNTFKVAVGAEYIPTLLGRNYFQRVRYRLGAHYSDSYITVKNSQNKELGLTLGLGLPLKNQKSMVNFAFEYLHVKPQNKDFLSESYFQFNVGLTFNEFWFFKNKIK